MPAPNFKAIADSALTAIYELTNDGKAEASFQGRSYRAIDLPQLIELWKQFRTLAVANGEQPLVPGVDKVAVSTPLVTDVYWWT